MALEATTEDNRGEGGGALLSSGMCLGGDPPWELETQVLA